MSKSKKVPSIAVTLATTIKAAGATGATWKEICAAIELRGKVRNWLTEVRGPLQGLMNLGVIARTDDLYTETYVAVVVDDAMLADEARMGVAMRRAARQGIL